MSVKKVAIVATMPRKGFSGGRYHALIMALAFAIGGHRVTFYTNTVPEMWDQIIGENEQNARKVRFQLFSEVANGNLGDSKFNLVVCVPGGSFSEVYHLAIKIARKNKAGLAFLNFESGNWFNKLSPTKRSIWRWWPWRLTAFLSDSIVSSSFESNKFAMAFYHSGKHANFITIPPAVNDHVKRVSELEPREEFRVFIPTRIRGGSHKGTGDFSLILSKLTKPCEVILNVDEPNDDIVRELKEDLRARGIAVQVSSSIGEEEKFKEYCKASVTLFPSYFEGFGYPPLESILCGTPCIAYELPVVAEVTRGHAYLTKRGDPMEMARILSEMQRERPARINAQIRSELLEYYSLDAYSMRLESLFGSNRRKIWTLFQVRATVIVLSLKSFGVMETLILDLFSRIEQFKSDRSLQ